MTYSEVVTLTGDQRSLSEVRGKRDPLPEFRRFGPFSGHSGRHVG